MDRKTTMRRVIGAAACVVALAAAAGCQAGPPEPTASPPGASATGGEPAQSTSPPPPDSSPTLPSASSAPSPSELVIEPDPEADLWTLDQINWRDGADGVPVLEFVPPYGTTGPVAKLVADGDGEEIRQGDTVTFEYSMYAGDTGQLAFSTYQTGQPQTISVQPDGMSQTFANVLIGSHVGAKVLFATIDTSETVPTDRPVTMFMAVTVTATRTPLERAEGSPVEAPSWLPKVTLDSRGAPAIEIPSSRPAPHELVAQTLILGTGPALAEEQTAIVKFTAWLWDGTEFDSTWGDNASMAWRMLQSEAMPGLLQGLVGQTVGSQVLLVIPPDLAFGELEMDGIPPESTLVYVIDILDAQ
jgi:peptidylprolyl isomerase